jgi:hypothetical protein
MFRQLSPTLLAMLLLTGACKKEEPSVPGEPPSAAARLRLLHRVDGLSLTFDTLAYTNEAGNPYDVSRLEYYLSELVLYGSGGTANDTLHGPWYINGRETTELDPGDLPLGTYSGASVLLGLPPALNVTGALPNTLDNINMAWPVPMGGGYHFMKFEGHFLSGGALSGFAMHLGTDGYLPRCTLAQGFTITDAKGALVLTFNLNEVFRAPHLYDLEAGNYSMGDTALMGRLRDNCADAFSIAYQP